MNDTDNCLTNLAKCRLELMKKFNTMAFNHGNDINGNWATWNEMKIQLDKIDNLILILSNKSINNEPSLS